MIFFPPPSDIATPYIAEVSSASERPTTVTGAGLLERNLIRELKLGQHVYQLCQQRKSIVTAGTYTIEGISPLRVGHGENYQEAK